MSDPKLEFVHAPDRGWRLIVYRREVIVWEDGSLSYHPISQEGSG